MVWDRFGEQFSGKICVFDGRVAKKRRPDSGPIGPDWLRFARQIGAGSVARNLPSTRTGGQDDVSLNKLPQIRFAKLLNEFASRRSCFN